MKLENDRYEELMIDLALLKKQGQQQNLKKQQQDSLDKGKASVLIS